MAPMNGTIKRLVSDKGFGFILAGDGNEYFFHNSACTQTPFDELREGQAVTFEKGQGPKGPRGENVRVAKRFVTRPARELLSTPRPDPCNQEIRLDDIGGASRPPDTVCVTGFLILSRSRLLSAGG